MSDPWALDVAGAFCEPLLILQATEWGLFELTRTPCSAEQVACHLSFRVEVMESVLDALVALKLLRKLAGRRYVNAPLADDHLVHGAKDDLRAYFAHSLEQARHWVRFEDVLRPGFSASWQQDQAVWADEKAHLRFLDAMSQEAGEMPAVMADLPVWRTTSRFIDAGGGHARYAAAIAVACPNIRGTVWDVPFSESAARRTLRTHGVSERVNFEARDIRDSSAWHGIHDAVLLANVVGSFDPPSGQRLIRDAAASVPRGGVVVVLSPWLDADRVRPTSSAILALHLFLGCGKGWVPPETFIRTTMSEAGLEVDVFRVSEDEGVWIGSRP